MRVRTSWKGGDLSVQVANSSAALSKFLTYSLYIFRKGASFWITSPMRGVTGLQEGHPGAVLSLRTLMPSSLHLPKQPFCCTSGCRQWGMCHPPTRVWGLPPLDCETSEGRCCSLPGTGLTQRPSTVLGPEQGFNINSTFVTITSATCQTLPETCCMSHLI